MRLYEVRFYGQSKTIFINENIYLLIAKNFCQDQGI